MNGLTTIYLLLVPVIAAIGYVVLHRKRARTHPVPTPDPAARPVYPGAVIKENAEAIIVAFVMALLIRCFCIEVFMIPSSSMEPTLLGDMTPAHRSGGTQCPFPHYHKSTGGDRIMVSKFFYSFETLRRFDVAVFRFPLNQSRNFIKRVVGLPGEEIFIENGNLFTRRPGEPRFHIARKPAETQHALWIDVCEKPDFLSSRDNFEQFWILSRDERPAATAYEVRGGTLLSSDSSTIYRYTEPIHDHDDNNGRDRVGEIRFSGELELPGVTGAFFVEFHNEYGRFSLDLGSSSALEFEGGGRLLRQPLPTAIAGRKVPLEFSIYDGLFQVRWDGQVYDLEFLSDHIEGQIGESRQSLSFGGRKQSFSLSGLRLGRDLFYKQKGSETGDTNDWIREGAAHAIRIPNDSYVMMGDNVPFSHDSRAWIRVTYRLKDGRTIECEEQEVNGVDLDTYRTRFNLQDLSDTVIVKADIHGNALWFPKEEIVSRTSARSPFIDGRFILGKAFWIWMPPGRWFRLIR